MYGPFVRLRLDDDTRVTLYPGDIVGRLASAAVPLNDPDVSEVHAYLSLRGEQLVLFALRGHLWVDGFVVSEVRLAPGVEIRLGGARALHVEAVHLPDAVVAVRIGDAPFAALLADPSSVLADGALVPGADPLAVARLWSTGEAWFVERGAGPEPLPLDVDFVVAGLRLRATRLPVQALGATPTAGRAAFAPLEVLCRFDSVQIRPVDGAPVLLSGLGARVVSELAEMGGSARWDVVAAQLWPAEESAAVRARWDKVLFALRRRLDSAGVRPDLVRSSGGNVQLVLGPNDTLRLEGI